MYSKEIKQELIRIGQRIQKFRKIKHLTQEELAYRVGVDRSYMAKIEQGKSGMTVQRLLVIARELQIWAGELFK